MMDEEIKVIFTLDEEQPIDCVFRIDATTFDYKALDKKPQINGVTLIGNKSSSDLHLASEQDIIDVNERITSVSEYFEEDIERVENNINTLDEKVDGINANLTQQIEETQQDITNKYNELVNDIDTEIQARETADTTINQRITDVADELNQTIEDNVVALQQEDTALQNQINAHSTTLTAYDTRITNNANAISQEIINRQNADDNLQEQIDGITAGSDVKDIVGTYAELQAYDKSTLGDNDIIKVLQDETQDNASTYYRYVLATQSFTYIGKEGPFYTKSETDTLLNAKQDTITDLVTIRNNASDGKVASDTIATYGDIVTHNADEFQPVGDYATNTALTNGLATKQDTITDLSTIRQGASLGATALQSVPSEYVTDAELRAYHDDTKQDVITDLSDIRNNIATNTSNISYLDEKVRDIELFKFPNAVIIGEPTIQNGQVSGFSTVSYLQFPFILDLHNQAFQIDFSFTTATNVQTQQNILDSNFGLALAIQNGKGVMAISSNGTSWDIGSAIGNVTIQSNTTYYARLIWNRLQYKTQLSTDGVNYVDDMVITDTRSPYPRTMFIGGCDILETGHAGHPFLGTINMNKALMSVMGNVIWQGMDDAGLATRADLSLSNLDELGEKRFTDLQTSIDTKANDTNVVHNTGAETIAGTKTFSSVPVITSTALNIDNTDDVNIRHSGTNFIRNSSLGGTIISATASGTSHTIYFRPNGDTSTSNQATIDTNGIITATGFSGSLTGNVIGNLTGTATKATQDASGNVISTTYLKIFDIDLIEGAEQWL